MQASTTVMLCSALDRLLIEVSLEGQTQPIANPSYPRAALLGVELNAEIEYQTARDSTIGAEKPRRAWSRHGRYRRSEASVDRIAPPRRAITHPLLRETERLFALGR
jgi:hypothetical protein